MCSPVLSITSKLFFEALAPATALFETALPVSCANAEPAAVVTNSATVPAFINHFNLDVFIVYLLILYIGNRTIKTTASAPAHQVEVTELLEDSGDLDLLRSGAAHSLQSAR